MISTDCFNKSLRSNKQTRLHKKPRLLVASALLLAMVGKAQPLFTFGKHAVTTSSFLHSFNKNPEAGNRIQAMKAYLPLYIKYKLKVQDAYDRKMDTLPQQQEELFTYRMQLQESFILQQSNIEKLVDEAYERSKKDVLLGHIFFPFQDSDSASIATAKLTAEKAMAALKNGTSFNQVANQYNPNSLPANGVAGWITAFVLPYRFENAVYNAGPGGLSSLQQGSTGFHLFKKLQERPALGNINIAQILLWLPQDAEAKTVKEKQLLADSLHSLLEQGVDFGQLAMQFSNDRTSYASGGVLPTISVGQYEPAFESAAFALSPNNPYSSPIRTSFGIHLLKFVSYPLQQQAENTDEKEIIRQRIKSSDRAQIAREDFLQSLQKKLSFKQGSFSPTKLWEYTAAMLKNNQPPANGITPKTFLFAVGSEKVLAENWLLYLRGLPRSGDSNYARLYREYILQTTENYYRENLPTLEPDFKAQLDEFKDANLLFQAMDNKVWTAATTDTAGQRMYYEAHQQKYTWSDGAIALTVASPDSSIGAAFRSKLLQQPTNWRALAASFRDGVLVDSARLEKAQLPPVDKFEGGMKPGAASLLFKNPVDNSVTFTYIIAMKSGGDIRQFDEARGWVIGDFQQLLEEQWVAALKKKYPVKLNETVWQQLLKANNTETK